jgi:hypothetical protein
LKKIQPPGCVAALVSVAMDIAVMVLPMSRSPEMFRNGFSFEVPLFQ